MDNKKNTGEPEIINGFNFEKHSGGKGGVPRQGALILMIVQGCFLITIGSYLLAEMPSHNVTGSDRIEALVIIVLILAGGALLTILPSVRLAHGRFRGGSHENT
jgi:hypothetical protein